MQTDMYCREFLNRLFNMLRPPQVVQYLEKIEEQFKSKYGHIIISFILFSLVSLSGCVTRQDHENNMSSWLGASEEMLVDTWGPPSNFYETSNKKYLTWKSSSQTLVGGYPPTITIDYFGKVHSSGGMSPTLVTLNCDITMIIKDGVVDGWRSEGNNCYDF